MNLTMFKLIYIAFTTCVVARNFFASKIKIQVLSEYRDINIQVMLVSFVIAALAAFRPLSVPDTEGYVNLYYVIGQPGEYIKEAFLIGSRIIGIDYSFALLTSIFRCFNLGYRSLFFAVGYFNSYIILTFAIKIAQKRIESPNISRIIAFFFVYFALHYCCIAMRAGLSLSLCMIAVYYFYKKKYIGAFVFLYLAMMFHEMAFLLVLSFTIIWRIKTDGEKAELVIYGTYLLCLLNLLLNVGSIITNQVIVFIRMFFKRINVDSFSGYIYGQLDPKVGIKDWFTIIAFGILMLWLSKGAYISSNIKIIILCGMLITSLLYPIRAINRAADYFYIFLLPVIGTTDNTKTPYSILANIVALPLLTAVQLSL